ncbi:MAG: phosphoenolpyruvate carboxykinase [Sedimentisphaerales bacterium]
MNSKQFVKEGNQIIIHTTGPVCSYPRELLNSSVFQQVVRLYVHQLIEHKSPIWERLGLECNDDGENKITTLLKILAQNRLLEEVCSMLDYAQPFLEKQKRKALHEFMEGLYNFWRAFDRFMIVHDETGPSSYDRRPYRSFNDTIEVLTHIVRSTYRDICENITGDHPRIYRQVAAGCNVGLIAVPKEFNCPTKYNKLKSTTRFIRQVWIAPPMIIDPPMNTRTGQFEKVTINPLEHVDVNTSEYLCYPAQVGPLIVFVYIHQSFIGLGCALANLFELATDEMIANGPDAIYMFGADPKQMEVFGQSETVFYDDTENNLLIAAVPGKQKFGYFGYLKKMILTLHNAVMMKRGYMPYHGAFVRIVLKNGKDANILLIGDTATGKSESIEAFRILGKDVIRELKIIADDMGSLSVSENGVLQGFGTEIGAFVRLDDLQQGYAFGQIDRAIIMSPQKINARVVLPVTTMDEVLCGYEVNYILYANNYEQVDTDHDIIEKLNTSAEAQNVFRAGAAMSKGTTTATGLVHSYYANIFGAPQYRQLHETLAQKTFDAAFNAGVFVGQVRTRLGIVGYESKGPEAVATALLKIISDKD